MQRRLSHAWLKVRFAARTEVKRQLFAAANPAYAAEIDAVRREIAGPLLGAAGLALWPRPARAARGDLRFIFVRNSKFFRRNNRLERTFGNSHGRDTYLIADLKTVVSADATFVHPHFAAAQNAIDVALRHTLRQPQ